MAQAIEELGDQTLTNRVAGVIAVENQFACHAIQRRANMLRIAMAQHSQSAVLIHRIATRIASAGTVGKHVAEFAGTKTRPVDQLVLAENRPTDASTDSEHQKIGHLRRFALPALGQQHTVGVVFHRDRQPGSRLEPRFHGEVIKSTDSAAHGDKTAVRIDIARRADGYSFTRRMGRQPRQHCL